MRPDKINYYLDIATAISNRSTCLRRKFGSIIVKDDVIVSTGYNGAPTGRTNCCDCGYCIREKLNIPRGTRYDICKSTHSEVNAIISASRTEMKDATLYLAGTESNGKPILNAAPCQMCRRVIINSGIKNVICRTSETEYKVYDVYEDFVKVEDQIEGY